MHSENLNYQILSSDFQALLLPLNIMNSIFFLPKYTIKNNIIKPNGIISHAISFFAMSVLFVNQIYCTANAVFDQLNRILHFVSIMSNCVLYILKFSMFLICNITQRFSNVQMIIKIYKSHTILINVKSNDVQIFKFLNWIYIIIVFVVNIISSIIQMYMGGFRIQVILYLLSFIYFDVNILFAIRLLKLIRLYFNMWISEVKYFTLLCSEFNTGRDYKMRELHWQRLFRAYLNLMDALMLFKKVTELPILIHTIDIFFNSLLHMQAFLEIQKIHFFINNSIVYVILQFIVIFWISKTLIFLIILTIECERIHKIIREVDTTCNFLLENQTSVESKRLCKNVLRTNKNVFIKMEACGLFMINGAFPIQLLGVIGSYSVVLLQFYYVK